MNCERGLGVVEVSPATRHKAGDKKAMRGVLLAKSPYLKGVELGGEGRPRGLAPQDTTAKILEALKGKQGGTAELPARRGEPR